MILRRLKTASIRLTKHPIPTYNFLCTSASDQKGAPTDEPPKSSKHDPTQPDEPRIRIMTPEEAVSEFVPRGREDPTYYRRTTLGWKSYHFAKMIDTLSYEYLSAPPKLHYIPNTIGDKRPGHIVAARNGMTVEKFLKTIGRGCDAYIKSFDSWDDFASSRGREMKEKEIPIKQRKWMMRWLEKYRQGEEPRFVKFTSKAHKNQSLDWYIKEKEARKANRIVHKKVHQ